MGTAHEFRRLRWIAALGSCAVAGCVASSTVDQPSDWASHAPTAAVVPFITARELGSDGEYGAARGVISAGDCVVAFDEPRRKQVIDVGALSTRRVLNRLASGRAPVTIYVHGYNVAFEDACRRAALFQEQFDLGGRFLLFSWPSTGRASDYLRDLSNVEWSVVPFYELLKALGEVVGLANINVVGHSLGARLAVDAVSDMSRDSDERGSLGHLVLVAPDIDSDIFVRDLADIRAGTAAITLYVSRDDRALRLSSRLHGRPRLGEPGDHLAALAGIDIVNVPALEVRIRSGHDYHLSNRLVVADLRRVLSRAPLEPGIRSLGVEQ